MSSASGIQGIDIEAAEEMARQLDEAAQQLLNAGEKVSLLLAETLHEDSWRGRNADEFRRVWRDEMIGKLTTVTTMLQQAAAELRRRAAEQRAISDQ